MLLFLSQGWWCASVLCADWLLPPQPFPLPRGVLSEMGGVVCCHHHASGGVAVCLWHCYDVPGWGDFTMVSSYLV